MILPASSRVAGRRPSMRPTDAGWRTPIMAHLRRCLLAPPCGVAGPRLSRRSSAPSIWTILGALPRTGVVHLIICAGIAASLALAADAGFAFAQGGDSNVGKAIYDRKC